MWVYTTLDYSFICSELSGPTQPTIQMGTGSFYLAGNAARACNWPPPSCAHVNAWSYIFTPPYVMSSCL